MTHKTKLKLAVVHQLCDAEDKSTEYMFELMQDACEVNLDCVLAYMQLTDEERKSLFEQINEVTEMIIKLDGI